MVERGSRAEGDKEDGPVQLQRADEHPDHGRPGHDVSVRHFVEQLGRGEVALSERTRRGGSWVHRQADVGRIDEPGVCGGEALGRRCAQLSCIRARHAACRPGTALESRERAS